MIFFFFFIQKRHKADSVVNKKECQGIKNSSLSFMIKVFKVYLKKAFLLFLLIYFLFCSLVSPTTVLRNGAWEIVHWEKVCISNMSPFCSSPVEAAFSFYLSISHRFLCCLGLERNLSHIHVTFILSPFSRGFPLTRHCEARPRNHAVETFVLCLTAVSAHSLIHVNAH